MYRLLDVAVLHMVLELCAFVLFVLKLDSHLGLVVQDILIKFLLFICFGGIT